jgi:N-formylglutamate amidohydrolase
MASQEVQGFKGHNLSQLTVPVLVSVPHAGRYYPSALFENLRLSPESLLRLEDRYADLLVRDAAAASVPTIIAQCARAWIDLNRDEQDLDADMVVGLDRRGQPAPGAKQRGGLGLIPRRLIGAGDIWRGPIALSDVDQRIAVYHRPYHAQVSDILSQMHNQFGIAILLDLHSMPPISETAGCPPPDFVIGDRFGRSASSRFSEYLMMRIKAHGFKVNLNNPYAGDHMLRRHGDPNKNIHALQLEIDRTLYLDSALREPSKDLPNMVQLIANIVRGLADEALGQTLSLAAE